MALLGPSTTAGLQVSSLFAGIEDGSRRRLEGSLTRRRLRCGESLWWRGEPAEHVTFIEQGLVKIARSGVGGESSVLGVFGPGDSIGLAAALDHDTLYPADAVVVSPFAELARVSAADVRCAMATDIALAGALQRAMSQHTSVLWAKISVVGAGSVTARLATLFVHLADRFGTSAPAGGRTLIAVVLTRATLAGFVEARVETVIRALSEWRRSDVLRTTHAGFEVDYAALLAISVDLGKGHGGGAGDPDRPRA